MSGPVRDGQAAPSGCGWCDRPERGHDDGFRLYASDRHPYQPPTQRQIKARMHDRRANKETR